MSCLVCGDIEHEVICDSCLSPVVMKEKKNSNGNVNRRDNFLYKVKCSCGNERGVSYSSIVKHFRRIVRNEPITCNKCCPHGVKKGEGKKGFEKIDDTPIEIAGGCVIANAYTFKPRPGDDYFSAMSSRCGESDLTCRKYDKCCSAASERGWLGFINTSEKKKEPLLKGELEKIISLEIVDNERIYDVIEAIVLRKE